MGTDFIDRIREIAAKIPKQREQIQTEEATKTALVMPFINALGYNVFDPSEVVPEFTADVGMKKGEKVDYAIMMEGKPIILIECKWCGTNLDEADASQLYRYFSVAGARIGVLTNGIVYRFFTDLEELNKMDKKSFLEFNMLDIQEPLVAEIKKLTKSAFDLDEMLTAASDLKYTKEIKRILAEESNQPSEDFVRFFTSQVYPGRMTQTVRQQFTDITRRAFKQFINEQINDRLKSALAGQSETPPGSQPSEVSPAEGDTGVESRDNRIVTTEEELEAYYLVKAILREVMEPGRVAYRDHINFFNILLDDTIRKPICRLYFHTAQKYIGLIDENKQEETVPIQDLNDIYRYADRLKATTAHYDKK